MNTRRFGAAFSALLVVFLLCAPAVPAQQGEEKPAEPPPGEPPPPPQAPEAGEAKEEQPEEPTGGDLVWNVNLHYGARGMDGGEGGDWYPYDDFQQYGIETTWGKKDQPLLFAIDAFYAMDDADPTGLKVESKLWEFAPGLRKYWVLRKRWVPYAGLGVTYLQADFETIESSSGETRIDTDATWGFWVGGGCLLRVGGHFNLGLTARFELNNPFTIAGADRDANSGNVGLLIGWGSRLTEQ